MRIPSDLRKLANNGKLAVVAGAGVSAATAQGNSIATWRGLLEHGIDECTRHGTQKLEAKSANDLKSMLQTDDLDNWLAIATLIERKLGHRSNEWNMWIRETIGELKVESAALLDAIYSLDAPIVTTNYDTLLSRPGRKRTCIPLDWQQKNFLQLLQNDPLGYIMHVHGCADRPEHIVFGMRSYTSILNEERLQTFLRNLSLNYGLLFVGFGAGIEDPNFQPFFEFIAKTDSAYRNYILVKDGDDAKFNSVSNVHAVSFGSQHSDLPNFIRSIPYGTERLVYNSGHTKSEAYEPKTEFQDNSISPTMVHLDSGTFRTDCGVEVGISRPFSISKYPITVREWDYFCSEAGPQYRKMIGDLSNPKKPVVGITIPDAVAYTRWLSELTGFNYRLPSENEWEFAARANSETRFWWGEHPSHDHANFRGGKHSNVLEVGDFPENQFGVAGQLGNTWEWTGDNSFPTRHSQQYCRLARPGDGGNPEEWVLKGGCFYYGDEKLHPGANITMEADAVFNSVGFRVIREIPSTIEHENEYILASGIGPVCLSVHEVAGNTSLGVAEFGHSASNVWVVERVENTMQISLKHRDTGLYLVRPDDFADYSSLELREDIKGLRKKSKWELVRNPGGFLILASETNKVIDLDGGRTKSQPDVILFEKHGNFNQIWNLVNVKHLG
ncbi:SUMF1/EgtB/PvdO family nonheme iron enzyme [Sulfitobacter sp. HNIBRBA2951]|uniref:SUMF1/EgtB/PvdO family nonheme iron enzyme n=1 Tax=Sulfitobacter aquimarinus TaxID=3158557 RepID=UPI0032DEFAB4